MTDTVFSNGLDLTKSSLDRMLEAANYKLSWLFIDPKNREDEVLQKTFKKNADLIDVKPIASRQYTAIAYFRIDKEANGVPFDFLNNERYHTRKVHVKQVTAKELIETFGKSGVIYAGKQTPKKTTDLAKVLTKLFGMVVAKDDILEQTVPDGAECITVVFNPMSLNFAGSFRLDVTDNVLAPKTNVVKPPVNDSQVNSGGDVYILKIKGKKIGEFNSIVDAIDVIRQNGFLADKVSDTEVMITNRLEVNNPIEFYRENQPMPKSLGHVTTTIVRDGGVVLKNNAAPKQVSQTSFAIQDAEYTVSIDNVEFHVSSLTELNTKVGEVLPDGRVHADYNAEKGVLTLTNTRSTELVAFRLRAAGGEPLVVKYQDTSNTVFGVSNGVLHGHLIKASDASAPKPPADNTQTPPDNSTQPNQPTDNGDGNSGDDSTDGGEDNADTTQPNDGDDADTTTPPPPPAAPTFSVSYIVAGQTVKQEFDSLDNVKEYLLTLGYVLADAGDKYLVGGVSDKITSLEVNSSTVTGLDLVNGNAILGVGKDGSNITSNIRLDDIKAERAKSSAVGLELNPGTKYIVELNGSVILEQTVYGDETVPALIGDTDHEYYIEDNKLWFNLVSDTGNVLVVRGMDLINPIGVVTTDPAIRVRVEGNVLMVTLPKVEKVAVVPPPSNDDEKPPVDDGQDEVPPKDETPPDNEETPPAEPPIEQPPEDGGDEETPPEEEEPVQPPAPPEELGEELYVVRTLYGHESIEAQQFSSIAEVKEWLQGFGTVINVDDNTGEYIVTVNGERMIGLQIINYYNDTHTPEPQSGGNTFYGKTLGGGQLASISIENIREATTAKTFVVYENNLGVSVDAGENYRHPDGPSFAEQEIPETTLKRIINLHSGATIVTLTKGDMSNWTEEEARSYVENHHAGYVGPYLQMVIRGTYGGEGSIDLAPDIRELYRVTLTHADGNLTNLEYNSAPRLADDLRYQFGIDFQDASLGNYIFTVMNKDIVGVKIINMYYGEGAPEPQSGGNTFVGKPAEFRDPSYPDVIQYQFGSIDATNITHHEPPFTWANWRGEYKFLIDAWYNGATRETANDAYSYLVNDDFVTIDTTTDKYISVTLTKMDYSNWTEEEAAHFQVYGGKYVNNKMQFVLKGQTVAIVDNPTDTDAPLKDEPVRTDDTESPVYDVSVLMGDDKRVNSVANSVSEVIAALAESKVFLDYDDNNFILSNANHEVTGVEVTKRGESGVPTFFIGDGASVLSGSLNKLHFAAVSLSAPAPNNYADFRLAEGEYTLKMDGVVQATGNRQVIEDKLTELGSYGEVNDGNPEDIFYSFTPNKQDHPFVMSITRTDADTLVLEQRGLAVDLGKSKLHKHGRYMHVVFNQFDDSAIVPADGEVVWMPGPEGELVPVIVPPIAGTVTVNELKLYHENIEALSKEEISSTRTTAYEALKALKGRGWYVDETTTKGVVFTPSGLYSRYDVFSLEADNQIPVGGFDGRTTVVLPHSPKLANLSFRLEPNWNPEDSLEVKFPANARFQAYVDGDVIGSGTWEDIVDSLAQHGFRAHVVSEADSMITASIESTRDIGNNALVRLELTDGSSFEQSNYALDNWAHLLLRGQTARRSLTINGKEVAVNPTFQQVADALAANNMLVTTNGNRMIASNYNAVPVVVRYEFVRDNESRIPTYKHLDISPSHVIEGYGTKQLYSMEINFEAVQYVGTSATIKQDEGVFELYVGSRSYGRGTMDELIPILATFNVTVELNDGHFTMNNNNMDQSLMIRLRARHDNNYEFTVIESLDNLTAQTVGPWFHVLLGGIPISD